MDKILKIFIVIIPVIAFIGLTLGKEEQQAIENFKKYYIEIRSHSDGIVIEITNRWAKFNDRLIGDKELDEMAPIKEHLVRLFISSDKITEQGYKKLFIYTNLELLNIKSQNFNDSCSTIFTEMKKLNQLRLEKTKITDKTLKEVSNLKKLELLDVSDTKISDDGLEYVAEMPRLKYLEINGTKISDKGLEILSKSKSLTSIRMRSVNATDKGAQYLLNMKNLINLSIGGTKISFGMRQKLQEVLKIQGIMD